MFKIILNLIKVSSCIMCSGFIGFLYIWVPRIAAILITSVFEEYLPHPRTLLGIQHPCKVSCQIYYFFYSGRIHEKYSILFPWTSSQTKITLHDNMRGQDILQTEDCWEKSTCFKYKYPCWCKAPPPSTLFSLQELVSPGLFGRPQLHEPLILISFLVIASLLFHRSPAKEKPQDPIFDPVLMSLLTLMVPIDLQNIFHACMVF